MTRTFCLLLAVYLFPSGLATVTFDVDAAFLKDASGGIMPSTGLVIFVASTSDSSFADPSPGSFISGDEREIARWDLTVAGGGGGFGPGVLQSSVPNFSLDSTFTTGDPLQIYWFPTLNRFSTTPGFGAPYGKYRHDTGVDGSDPWTIPSDGDTRTLLYASPDAGGNVANPDGRAIFTVVPEPAGYTVAAGIGCLVWVLAAFRDRQASRPR